MNKNCQLIKEKAVVKYWIATMGLMLAACGGGSAVEPQVESLGPSATLTPEAQEALDKLNEIRRQAGLPALTAHPMLTSPAAHHAQYMAQTDDIGLVESKVNAKEFTGATLVERMSHSQVGFASIVENVTRANGTQATSALSDLLSQPLTRVNLLQSRFTHAGLGLVQKQTYWWYDPWLVRGSLSVIVANQLDANPPSPALTVWPLEGATIPGGYNSDKEASDLMPNATRVGYPITVQVDSRLKLDVSSFTLTRASDSQRVAVTVVSNKDNAAVPSWAAVLMANEPLKAGESYVVNFKGSAQGVDLTRSWTVVTQEESVKADKDSVKPGETVKFTISGLDATEPWYLCMQNNSALDSMEPTAIYMNPYRKVVLNPAEFTMPANTLDLCKNADGCQVGLVVSRTLTCDAPVGVAHVKVMPAN